METDTTQMLDEAQVQVHVDKHRVGLWRLKETCVRAPRTINLSQRSERCQENTPAVEWLSTSIVHELRNPLGQSTQLPKC
jgi:hypothetical protein